MGVVSCGGCGLFALQQSVQAPGVQQTAMAGTHPEATLAAARRFGIPDIADVESLVHRDDGDLAYVTTPPFPRHPQALAARSPDLVHWGKHEVLMGGVDRRESGRIGAGTPLLRTSEGWLEIYPGSELDERGVILVRGTHVISCSRMAMSVRESGGKKDHA